MDQGEDGLSEAGPAGLRVLDRQARLSGYPRGAVAAWPGYTRLRAHTPPVMLALPRLTRIPKQGSTISVLP
jgi:hypothetical protein